MKKSTRYNISRRSMLQCGLLGVTGLTFSDYLRITQAVEKKTTKADAVLFLNLAGGPAHLDTLDMKPNAPEETRGEFKSIQSKIPGLSVCEHLPQLAANIDRFTLLRGISHTTGDHPQGQAYIATGNRPSPAIKYPSYGSIVTKELESHPDLPAYIAIPDTEWTAGYMGDSFAPFKTNAVPKRGQPFSVRGITLSEGVSIEKVKRREELLADLNTAFRGAENNQLVEALDNFGQQAYNMVTSSRTREAFDVANENQKIVDLFADNDVGQSLLLATRLIEHGVRFVTVTNAGWDTHTDNFDGHKRLMPPFDQGLTAAVEALSQKGLLERTLVVAMGEFGRTPAINKNMGRDHYPRANWCLLAGAGVQPGQLIGATDENGTGPTDDTEIHPDDIGATILHTLGIDHETEYYTKTGRPVSLIPHGRVMHDWFG